ncbi:hypothetical protein [Noviherbaspirillum sp. UKPF54]|uniref:hypothetical protein n=1 Tax=Noviherbaspirillum sp. UKPF54 TaxID=2601898 RepID=UPI001AF01705|nr:hypothetical protein [Noviherbaspirillum sp. UKPF54]
MGNRGILHDASNRIVKGWAHKSWVTCLLLYKGTKRPKPFSAGNYSELFFLDEATAFAAGHRPCSYCQRQRSNAFKAAWLSANVPPHEHAKFTLPQLDACLHPERTRRGGGKVTYEAALATLPTGSMFQHDINAYLVFAGRYMPWSFAGYGLAVSFPTSAVVTVLTPQSVVAAFSSGFVPYVHESAIR